MLNDMGAHKVNRGTDPGLTCTWCLRMELRLGLVNGSRIVSEGLYSIEVTQVVGLWVAFKLR